MIPLGCGISTIATPQILRLHTQDCQSPAYIFGRRRINWNNTVYKCIGDTTAASGNRHRGGHAKAILVFPCFFFVHIQTLPLCNHGSIKNNHAMPDYYQEFFGRVPMTGCASPGDRAFRGSAIAPVGSRRPGGPSNRSREECARRQAAPFLNPRHHFSTPADPGKSLARGSRTGCAHPCPSLMSRPV